MKRRGPFVWKGKVIGGLFGILAGPFGIFFGFLIGHLVDLLLDSARIRKEISFFLTDPEASGLSQVEDGAFSFFCLAGLLLLAQGKSLKRRTNGLLDKLRVYFPVRDSDCKHYAEIADALEAFESEPDLRGHARSVRRMNPDFGSILPAFRELGGLEENASLTEPVIAILSGIAAEWEVSAEGLSDLLGFSGTQSRDPWVVLGLKPGAGEEEVKRVFRVLASNFHPDGAAVLSDLQKKETEEAFKRIRSAYEDCLRELTRRPA